MVKIWLKLCMPIAAVVSTASFILSSSKSRMVTFWYRFTHAVVEKGR